MFTSCRKWQFYSSFMKKDMIVGLHRTTILNVSSVAQQTNLKARIYAFFIIFVTTKREDETKDYPIQPLAS